MAAGANQLMVALVGIGVVAVAGVLMWPPGPFCPWRRNDSSLALRIGPGDSIREAVAGVLAMAAERCDLVAAAIAKQGAALDLSYRVRLRPGVTRRGE